VISLDPHPRGVILPLQVRAGGRKNELSGGRDGRLLLSVTQAPEKGKANAAVISLLSKALKIPKTRLEILSGATSAKKRILVSGVEPSALREKLAPWVGQT
jgi:uncharacterized protein YggU (UPF0235/DUF167 family)